MKDTLNFERLLLFKLQNSDTFYNFYKYEFNFLSLHKSQCTILLTELILAHDSLSVNYQSFSKCCHYELIIFLERSLFSGMQNITDLWKLNMLVFFNNCPASPVMNWETVAQAYTSSQTSGNTFSENASVSKCKSWIKSRWRPKQWLVCFIYVLRINEILIYPNMEWFFHF